MGRKNRKKQDDDEYFNSLASASTPSETVAVDEAAVLRAERAAAAAEEKRVAEADAAVLRAENAARAKAMMEKRRSRKKKEDEEPAVEEEEEEEGGLTWFGRLLLSLRARAWFFWLILKIFASPATLRRVEVAACEDDDVAAERRRRDMLYCPATATWFDRAKVSVVDTYRDGERLQKKATGRELWVPVKEGEGWATHGVSVLCMEGGDVFDATAWVASHLCDPTLLAPYVDSGKPVLTVRRDDDGLLVATLLKKVQEDVRRAAAGEEAPPPKKGKLSRSEKKAKKLAYGR